MTLGHCCYLSRIPVSAECVNITEGMTLDEVLAAFDNATRYNNYLPTVSETAVHNPEAIIFRIGMR